MQAGSSYDLWKDQDFKNVLGSFENQDILWEAHSFILAQKQLEFGEVSTVKKILQPSGSRNITAGPLFTKNFNRQRFVGSFAYSELLQVAGEVI